MIISELLSQKASNEIMTISADADLMDVARMLESHNIGALIVQEEGGDADVILGVISERDIVRRFVAAPATVTRLRVRDVMSRDVIGCDASDDLVDTLDTMNKRGIRHVPVFDEGQLVSILSIRDFNMAYRRLQQFALTDYMTGLANRRHFMDLLEQEINRRARFGTPLSIIMVDIDRFKSINDTHGHAVGDRVICALGDLMKAHCRIYDVVGRLGGEEYAILCPNTRLAGAEVVCGRLIDATRRHRIALNPGELRFTASFGIYETLAEGENAESMLARVDELLYRAKEGGRDRLVSSDSDDSAVACEIFAA